ncbi:MAG: uroporphyrinogen-III synthase [Cellvibrionaceae bacterium]|jgi:uroporphyrinogen-III synthase
MQQTLTNFKIALPESRQLDVLANLFETRGANLFRCPLVSIHDSPRADEINAWLSEFIENTPDYLLILTGEGIKRLTGFAERSERYAEWQAALSRVYKLARGPKPNRMLKTLDLQADELALEPTTEGMILSLEHMELKGKSLAIQLYGEDPNERLQSYLYSRSVVFTTVAPYIYASDVETGGVLKLIKALAANELDLICFTSKAQYDRLVKVAKQHDCLPILEKGLKQTKIAAVGPVVADQLKQAGFEVAVMPKDKYFMKPMVSAIESLLAK